MFAGLKKMLFGSLEMEVSGDTLVSEFENEFLRVFAVPIRVYNLSKEKKIQSGAGGRRASKDALIKDVSTKIVAGKSRKISIKDTEKVGDVEKKIENTLGIGVQIIGSDGKGFADNNKSLKEIKEVKSDDLVSLDVAVNSATDVYSFTKAFEKACGGVSVKVWRLGKTTGKILTGAKGQFAAPEMLLREVSEGNRISQHGIIVINTADKVKTVKKNFAKMYGLGIEVVSSRDGGLADDEVVVKHAKNG
ncbi:hypothetical protein [Succinimonas amylolytica]|uniref:hypothetical protein n=1 Tax=Succinimonas amylolytica TaxID=83769 RepID=UPI0023A8A08D